MPSDGLHPAATTLVPVDIPDLRSAQAHLDVPRTILKWHRLVLAVSLILTVAVGLAMFLRPPVPSAVAKILIKGDRGTPAVSGVSASTTRVSWELLQTETEFAASRIVLLPVARALRAQRGEVLLDAQLDADIEALRGALSATPVPNTTIIQLKFSAPSGARALRILELIVASYAEQHAIAYGGSTNLAVFLEDEASKSATQLKAAEDRALQWQKTNDVVSVESQFTTQLASVAESEGALKRNDVTIESTKAEISALMHDIAALPAQSVATRENAPNPLVARLKADIANEEATPPELRRTPLVDRLRADIAAAEVALAEATANPLVSRLKEDLVATERALADLRQSSPDNDGLIKEKVAQLSRLQHRLSVAESAPVPLFQRETVTAARDRINTLRRELLSAERDAEGAAQARIVGLRQQLAAAERDVDVRGRETMTPTPLREMLNRDLAAARARLTSLLSQQPALRAQHEAATKVLARLREKRLDFEGVSRDIDRAKALYVMNTKRLEDARMNVGLEKNQLTSIAVMEAPHDAGITRSMKRVALVALLGGLVGLGVGVAAALALEFFHWSLRTPEDVEIYLGVPVLATVPAVPKLRGRRRALPSPTNWPVEDNTQLGR
jgi:uncharacterized protein involved in exopolysaccharide biosynthesis